MQEFNPYQSPSNHTPPPASFEDKKNSCYSAITIGRLLVAAFTQPLAVIVAAGIYESLIERQGVGHFGLLGLCFIQITLGNFLFLSVVGLFAAICRYRKGCWRILTGFVTVSATVFACVVGAAFVVVSPPKSNYAPWQEFLIGSLVLAGAYPVAALFFDLYPLIIRRFRTIAS